VCYTSSVKLPISWTGQYTVLGSCPFHELGDSLLIFCPVYELGTTILIGQQPNPRRNIQIFPVHEVGRKWTKNRPVREIGNSRGQFMKWAISRIGCNICICIVSARQMSSRGLRDWRGYRAGDIMGIENVGPALARFLRSSDMIWAILRTLNHDDTATNNNTLTRDLQIRTNNEGSKPIGFYVLPLGECTLSMRRSSFQIRLSTIALGAGVYSVR
jgi:hypothetical protein